MTRLTPDSAQQEVLDAKENLVVIGRPGSGKTTVALWKATAVIDEATLLGHQSVLFLSFSRGAVERIGAESRVHLTAGQRTRLQIATYHSLCFEILQAHAPALGMKRPIRILSTEDEVIVKREYGDCDTEFARLETDESRVRFDRFAPLACQILKPRPVLRDAY